MSIERWEFVQQFQKALETTWYRLEVDGEHYCDVGFPDSESYESILEVCTCMVEADEKYKGKKVNSTYLNADECFISLHIREYRDSDWWTL